MIFGQFCETIERAQLETSETDSDFLIRILLSNVRSLIVRRLIIHTTNKVYYKSGLLSFYAIAYQTSLPETFAGVCIFFFQQC